jgi:hypothetical protein
VENFRNEGLERTMANWHALGATGAVQIASLLPELKRQSQEVGVVSMCIGKSVSCPCILTLDTNRYRNGYGPCRHVRKRMRLNRVATLSYKSSRSAQVVSSLRHYCTWKKSRRLFPQRAALHIIQAAVDNWPNFPSTSLYLQWAGPNSTASLPKSIITVYG